MRRNNCKCGWERSDKRGGRKGDVEGEEGERSSKRERERGRNVMEKEEIEGNGIKEKEEVGERRGKGGSGWVEVKEGWGGGGGEEGE